MSDLEKLANDLRQVLIPSGYPVSKERVHQGADAIDRLMARNQEAADEIASLRAQLATSQELCTKFEAAVGEDVGEMLRLREQIASARKALEPFSKMAAAMHVSGHCGGASSKDWPDKWSVRIEGYDGEHFHSPASFGGLLTVADFRRCALSDDLRGER